MSWSRRLLTTIGLLIQAAALSTALVAAQRGLLAPKKVVLFLVVGFTYILAQQSQAPPPIQEQKPPAAAPTTQTPNDGKFRIYVIDSQSWEVTGGWEASMVLAVGLPLGPLPQTALHTSERLHHLTPYCGVQSCGGWRLPDQGVDLFCPACPALRGDLRGARSFVLWCTVNLGCSLPRQ